MTNKNHMIITAATNMFARYGYSKTTMGDIAAEAGVARQTVYNAFPGKEEILRAVVRQAGEETYAAVMNEWADATTLEEKLSAFQTFGPLKWFEAIHAAPDWAELMDGMHKAASEEMTTLDLQWRNAITQMLNTDGPERTDATKGHDEIADFFYATSLNAKYGVKDIEQLRSRLRTIRAATLALLNT
ncbi:helix-turn-helix domain-containing protein [Yoonia sp. GPGPB17]|uniref:TetR/AcrR family transcriptional regulator n=1 Tax=Yoonia sp. GPGPB17 TaxID=3026147 RepID=UPI0030BFC953